MSTLPFTPDQQYSDNLTRFAGLPNSSPMGGGADKFLAFIDTELKPFIASKYSQANLADSTLVGDSLGALFVMHVLFTSPGSFNRYIAISPGVDVNADVIFDEERKLGNVAARLFMAIGERDIPTTKVAAERLYARMVARRRTNLRINWRVFPGETHESVFPVAIVPALRGVFDPPPVTPALKAYYEENAESAKTLAKKLDSRRGDR